LKTAGLDALPQPVELSAESPAAPERLLAGHRIAIARDAAFSFLYRANLDLLEAMGAELHYFSPLADTELPGADALWLPGGYPELHAGELAANIPMLESIRDFHQAGKPILAECGGLMVCADELWDKEGLGHALLGLLPGRASMAGRLKALGLQSLDTNLGDLRGHTYHHSTLETPCQPAARTRKQAGSEGEAVYRQGALTASYFHGYFPSAPALMAAIFRGESFTFNHPLSE